MQLAPSGQSGPGANDMRVPMSVANVRRSTIAFALPRGSRHAARGKARCFFEQKAWQRCAANRFHVDIQSQQWEREH